MKRKFFTLLVAALAIVGFQAKAADLKPGESKTTWIQTGDSTTAVQPRPMTAPYSNERGGYASKVEVANKLTFENGKFVYRAGKPNSANDKIDVIYQGANFVSFSKAVGTVKTSLKLKRYVGENVLSEHDQFVVFRATSSPGVNGNYNRVIDYWNTDQAAIPPVATGQILQPEDVKTGNFEGFLAVQATGYVDNGDLLIVLHNEKGELLLKTYKEYCESFVSGSFTPKKASEQWYPLYVKTTPPAGRWATPSDFAECKFWSFSGVDRAGKLQSLTAFERGKTSGTTHSTFTVKQVDYVVNGNEIFSIPSPNQVYANFQGINRDWPETTWLGDEYYGTAKIDPNSNNEVIPLFVLGAPDTKKCDVLSISRNNYLDTQSEQDGGYANFLELRGYGEYYDVTLTKPDFVVKTPGEAGYDKYTSLQKFAIWITEDGEYILYPAATYSWHYGEDKLKQPDKILPNSVLLYNDINVRYVAGTTTDAHKAWGIQIGAWNGRNSKPNIAKANFEHIVTAPNWIQTTSDYSGIKFDKISKCKDTDLSGRFFFIQVQNPDTLGLGASTLYDKAFNSGNYQYNREYVLSTQVGRGGAKRLVIVPKEQVMPSGNDRDDVDYWRNPYDSVNMAAHWEVQEVAKNVYRLINMLGDTLKFNITKDQYGYVNSGSGKLAGGYLPINSLMPGMNPQQSLGGHNPPYLLGRPMDTNGNPWDVTTWFARNREYSTDDTHDTWKFIQAEGSDVFFMELAGFKENISLTNVNRWYDRDFDNDHNLLCIGSGPNGRTYWQQDVTFEVNRNDVLTNYNEVPISACSGLTFELREIGYVPKYGPFYPTEPNSTVINTTWGGGFTDKTEMRYQKEDSLTAYTFLEGHWDITEALGVKNGLTLGFSPLSINDAAGTESNIARLVTQTNSNVVQFIPLTEVAAKRNSQINASGATNAEIDMLYNETYKWYVVRTKVGDKDKYLTFDTVNVAAGTNREKVGFAFDADSLANATPVRLYQPLVGDKKYNNFLIQFYLPKYNYVWNATAKKWSATENTFPDIENSDKYATTPGGGEVCFATLSNQSNYLFGTRVYSRSTSTATRFTIVPKDVKPCDCQGTFVTPKWLAQERLLSLPLNNQIYTGKAPSEIWIATGDGVTGFNAPMGTPANSAIVSVNTTAKGTTLTHTYVTNIRVRSGSTSSVAMPPHVDKADSTFITPDPTTAANFSGFQTDLVVPLYYIQNEEGKYLTVVPKSDMHDTRATVPDVNTVKLQWLDKYTTSKKDIENIGYDKRAFQYFAISGCEVTPEDGKYGNFVYLPLASYMVDYAKERPNSNATVLNNIIKNSKGYGEIYYNKYLGKINAGDAETNVCPGNDLTACYRISQYTAPDKVVKDLVVFNSSSSVGTGNLSPIEFRLEKQPFLHVGCTEGDKSNTVQDVNSGKFYAFNDKVNADPNGNEYLFNAHWTMATSTDDADLYTFTPELKMIYDKSVNEYRNQLMGKYYFIKTLKDDPTAYVAIDVSGYDNDNFVAKYDTLRFDCVEHAMPFFDLEADGGYNLAEKLTVLETPYLDRNLGITVITDLGTPEKVENREGMEGYRCFINKFNVENCDFKGAEFLNVYPQNKRYITDNHIIPYYSFSITVGDKEYFLNVDDQLDGDSVIWRELTKEEAAMLSNPEPNNEMKNFKFCLPYKRYYQEPNKVDGMFADKVGTCNSEKFHPVYLQTLDESIDDYPWLVIAGSATKFVTSRNFADAFLPTYGIDSKNLKMNIYSANYTYIDRQKVTSWVFGGTMQHGNVWVPLLGVATAKPGEFELTGDITSHDLNGSAFIAKAPAPDNFGIITGIQAPALTVEYRGDTTIGAWSVRPIWYYRIKNVDGTYLTDSRNNTKEEYLWQGTKSFVGYFGEDITADKVHTDKGILADTKFEQTFGFRYATKDGQLSDDQNPEQTFFIVSNADYKNKPAKENEYRYLAMVNNHLVFVEGYDNALVFQWGKKDENGNYTDLEVVGQGGIYGVKEGIRFVNTSGKVDIYSIDGRLIKSAVLTGAEETVSAPRGIAVVKNGSKVVKVVVK